MGTDQFLYIYEKQSFQHGRTFRHLKLAWSKLFQLTISSSKNFNTKIPLNDIENTIDEKTLMVIFGQEEIIADCKKKKRDTISFRDHVRLMIKFLIVANIK